ncbi:hypothetical protein QR680_005469 [Steinernema hermaphroditum]|uniref:Proteasome activator PA28 N-terminal domain-containing protein n=1 Tax=Steinernema hermaphroditum TaxID=289476 RepID=A0AA39HUH4_9BILA|nr:hypothetical protein QR680_005469 [Steinernema hermaphroditum]
MASEKSTTNGETDYTKKLSDYKKNLLIQAEKIVLEEFPKRVVQFNELLDDEQFSYELLSSYLPDLDFNLPRPEEPAKTEEVGPPKKRKRFEQNGELITDETGVSGTPVYGFVNGPVKCNKKLADLTDLVRPLLRNAVEDVNKMETILEFPFKKKL